MQKCDRGRLVVVDNNAEKFCNQSLFPVLFFFFSLENMFDSLIYCFYHRLGRLWSSPV